MAHIEGVSHTPAIPPEGNQDPKTRHEKKTAKQAFSLENTNSSGAKDFVKESKEDMDKALKGFMNLYAQDVVKDQQKREEHRQAKKREMDNQ